MPDELVPRPAATVVLLRETTGGLAVGGFEVFVLRRVASMAFAPSMTVFPGGGVDPADAAPAPWRGPEPAWFARRFGQSGPGANELSRRIVVAAVRELWEETGLLLAVPDTGPAADERAADGRPGPRVAPLLPRSTDPRASGFGDLLARDRRAIDAARLRPWAHWVTPPGRTRRYDTYFFVAAVPDGADPRLATTEADEGTWVDPAALLAADGDGSVRLMPPTRAVLTSLARHATLADVLAAEPEIPAWTRDADGEIVHYRPVGSGTVG